MWAMRVYWRHVVATLISYRLLKRVKLVSGALTGGASTDNRDDTVREQ